LTTGVFKSDGSHVKTLLETVIYVLKLVHSSFQPIILLECPGCFYASTPGKNNAATPHTIEAKLRRIRSFECFLLFFWIRSEECLDVTFISEPVATVAMTLIDSIQETLFETIEVRISLDLLIFQETVQLV
jgi:hypothetical protein